MNYYMEMAKIGGLCMNLLDLNTIQTMVVFGSGLIIGVIFGMVILSCISIGKEIKLSSREHNLTLEENKNE